MQEAQQMVNEMHMHINCCFVWVSIFVSVSLVLCCIQCCIWVCDLHL